MSCYRTVDVAVDEDGGGGDEKYEINSMGENIGHREKGDALRRSAGSDGKGRENVATYRTIICN